MQLPRSAFSSLLCLFTGIACFGNNSVQAQVSSGAVLSQRSPTESDQQLQNGLLVDMAVPPTLPRANSLKQNVSIRAADLTSPIAKNPEFAIAQSQTIPITTNGWNNFSLTQQPQASPSPSPTLSESALRQYILGFQLPPGAAIGLPVASVRVYVTNPPENSQTAQTYRQQIAAAFALSGGDNFSTLFAEKGLDRVQQLPFVAEAEYRVFETETEGQVTVLVVATIAEQPTAKPTQPSGVLVTGNLRDFPNLYTSDRAKVVGILNAGIANFLNTNTWFGQSDVFTQGNPLALSPAGKGTYSWQDFYFEPGFGGITQIGQIPLYAFGSASFIGAATLNPALFRSDSRFFARMEKLYGGLIYGYRKNASDRFAILLSGGRQPYGISDGFLFAQQSGASNGDIRAALLSNPRTAFQNTAFAKVRLNNFLLEGFYLDPDELDVINNNTKLIGANLDYNDNKNLAIGFTYSHVISSRFSYFTPGGQKLSREGLNVFYPRLRLTNPFGLNGLWMRAEYAHEPNDNFNMSANAWFGWIGYTFQDSPWRPTISYRYGFFSGDNPRTSTFERFDPLLSGGSPDSWIQGPSLVKVYQNSNLVSHRVEFKVRPARNYEVSLQYIYLLADQTNNLGGTAALSTLQSKEVGQEIWLTNKWNISRNLLLVNTASLAFPGAALQRAVSQNPGPWFFLQLSLLMFF
jgi:hypothetical protein